MGMDPHTIKELLQLQIWNRSSLLASGGAAAKSGDDSEFSGLLNSLLARQQDGQTDEGNVRNEQRAGKSMLAAAMLAGRAAPSSWSHYFQSGDNAGQPPAYDSTIQAASRKFGVDSALVKAVINAESSFNPNAVSRAGAKGLMQLMDGTGQAMGVADPFDPLQNIEGGTKYLSGLLRKYNGNPGAALAAYNAGPGRLDKLGIKDDRDLEAKLHLLPEETQQYVRKVMQLKHHYEA